MATRSPRLTTLPSSESAIKRCGTSKETPEDHGTIFSIETPYLTMASSSHMAKELDAIRVTASSGNVFADIGLPNADQVLLKAQLTTEIYRILISRKLTRTQARKVLRTTQGHVALLMRNRSGTLSAERLISFITFLGRDVEIRIKRTRKRKGQVSVVVA